MSESPDAPVSADVGPARIRCAAHNLALADDGHCVRCRVETRPPPPKKSITGRVMVSAFVVASLALLIVARIALTPQTAAAASPVVVDRTLLIPIPAPVVPPAPVAPAATEPCHTVSKMDIHGFRTISYEPAGCESR